MDYSDINRPMNMRHTRQDPSETTYKQHINDHNLTWTNIYIYELLIKYNMETLNKTTRSC